MALIGQVGLLVAMVLAVACSAAAFAGARTGRTWLVQQARRASYAVLAVVVVVNAAMLVALLTDEFGIRYVAQNSSRGTPTARTRPSTLR